MHVRNAGHDLQSLELHLTVNGKVRQHGNNDLVTSKESTNQGLYDYVSGNFSRIALAKDHYGSPSHTDPHR